MLAFRLLISCDLACYLLYVCEDRLEKLDRSLVLLQQGPFPLLAGRLGAGNLLPASCNPLLCPGMPFSAHSFSSSDSPYLALEQHSNPSNPSALQMVIETWLVRTAQKMQKQNCLTMVVKPPKERWVSLGLNPGVLVNSWFSFKCR